MKTNPLIKVTVVAASMLLLAGYVAYSAGAFENASIAAQKNSNMEVDSPGVKTAHPENIEIIPSTKSAPIFESEYTAPKDTTKKKKNPKMVNKTRANQQKNTNGNSGITPSNQGANQSNETVKPVIIPSSKSGRIFTPQKPDTSKPK